MISNVFISIRIVISSFIALRNPAESGPLMASVKLDVSVLFAIVCRMAGIG